MTVIEVTSAQIYLSTDNRAELLDLIHFIVRNYALMESQDQKAITLFDCRNVPLPPPMAKETL